jgi:predicted nucleic acid-binding protein
VQLVIADTGPINYLILIGHIDILPALFDHVILPAAVRDELTAGPALVRDWIAHSPSWIEVRQAIPFHEASLEALDAGEEDAIRLALAIRADLLLMDDREGVLVARRKGLTVTGTLGVLGLAAKQGLLSLANAFEQLKRTNFRYSQQIMDELLNEAAG